MCSDPHSKRPIIIWEKGTRDWRKELQEQVIKDNDEELERMNKQKLVLEPGTHKNTEFWRRFNGNIARHNTRIWSWLLQEEGYGAEEACNGSIDGRRRLVL
ncbi:hypothetical protein K432DRAFT_211159 [Lepidopterella palustris CBS 459.81]|uniref:Uncharacterized protein n=1 Tax=Lepidopterella palustris CBS 459.81 TaxID=1314670 RepID=A0A8E2JHJ9_9PEZI|nr:hypothetical protein K432DRAFT_211159 [Lepidopterella palustris CBS 459.81]